MEEKLNESNHTNVKVFQFYIGSLVQNEPRKCGKLGVKKIAFFSIIYHPSYYFNYFHFIIFTYPSAIQIITLINHLIIIPV